MTVALLGLFFILGFAQGGLFRSEPAIIEELRNGKENKHFLDCKEDLAKKILYTQPLSSRIVAGWPAAEGQFPYQVNVRMVASDGFVTSCGGSILQEQWVLTAAHCLANRETFVVRFGLTNLTRPDYIVETTKKYIHPGYIEILAGVQTDDIALLEIDIPIPFSANIQPIRLMNSAQKNINYVGVVMTVSGYGLVDDFWNGGSGSEILRWVLQRGVTNEECKSWYSGSSIIQEQTICTEYYNNTSQSSCQGDSGGPLVLVDSDNKLTQVGVVSFGHVLGCNHPVPSGFVRPGHYHDWLTEVTGFNFDWAFPSEETSSSSSEEDIA